jgi:hypothetical protein
MKRFSLCLVNGVPEYNDLKVLCKVAILYYTPKVQQ